MKRKEGIGMGEVKKCSKCGGEMKNGYIQGPGHVQAVRFTDKISFWTSGNTEKTCAFACKSCGYIELYIEKKEMRKKE